MMEVNTLAILADLKNVCDRFFSAHGYIKCEPEAIVPLTDKTVLYTNSAIIAFKNKIAANNIPNQPHYLLQECIRLHETKLTPNEHYILQRMSCFSMVGVLAPMQYLEQSCHAMLSLLLDVLGINKARLVLHAATQDEVFWRAFDDCSVNILWDQTPADDYEWRYGMPNITGRGLNIGVLPAGVNAQTISLVDEIDIGQIIVIKNKNTPFCFEIALGMEAFLWRKYEKLSPFAVSEIAAFMPFKFEPLYLQLMDAIVLAVIFYGNSVDLFTRQQTISKGKNRLSAVKKAVKNIAEIEAFIDPDLNVDQVMLEYAEYRQFKKERIARLLQAIDVERASFKHRQQKLLEYSATCADFILKKRLTYREACRKLRDKAQNYGLYAKAVEVALRVMQDLINRG